MVIHPAVERQFEALINTRAAQGAQRIRLTGVTQEDRRDIRAHMIRARLDPLHAVGTRLLAALLEDLLREHGGRENVDIFVVVRFPELGGLDQHILLGVDVQPGLCDEITLRFLVAHNIKISRITVAQFVERFLAGHTPSSLFDAKFSWYDFTNFMNKLRTKCKHTANVMIARHPESFK